MAKCAMAVMDVQKAVTWTRCDLEPDQSHQSYARAVNRSVLTFLIFRAHDIILSCFIVHKVAPGYDC